VTPASAAAPAKAENSPVLAAPSGRTSTGLRRRFPSFSRTPSVDHKELRPVEPEGQLQNGQRSKENCAQQDTHSEVKIFAQFPEETVVRALASQANASTFLAASDKSSLFAYGPPGTPARRPNGG